MDDDRDYPNFFYHQEFWNGISHLIGALLAISGLFILLKLAPGKDSIGELAILIYGLSMVSMFCVSSSYHFISNPGLKRILRILDHINIYLLIAGTYTPICLLVLSNGNGWTLFYAVWGIALVGVILKIFFTGKHEVLSLILYLGMGWLIVLDIGNVWNSLPLSALILMFVGGAFYTLGTIFYARDQIPYFHFIWHLFVLAGAAAHWAMVYAIMKN